MRGTSSAATQVFGEVAGGTLRMTTDGHEVWKRPFPRGYRTPNYGDPIRQPGLLKPQGNRNMAAIRPFYVSEGQAVPCFADRLGVSDLHLPVWQLAILGDG